MSKLDVTLRAAQPLTPGVPVQATIEISTEEPVHIDWAQVRIVGHEGWKGAQRVEFLNLVERFMGKAHLQGRQVFTVTFVVPAGSPPSFQHPDAEVSYAIEVDVSIPWAIDPHWRWPLLVTGLPATLSDDAASPVSVNALGGDGLSLERDRYMCGEWMRGRLRWFAVDAPHAAYVGIRETLFPSHEQEMPLLGRVHEVRVSLDGSKEGSAFELALPPHLTPNFHARTLVKGWEVFVRRTDGDPKRPYLSAPILIQAASLALEGQASAPRPATLSFVPPPMDLPPSMLAMGSSLGWQASAGALSRTMTIGLEKATARVHRVQREKPHLMAEVGFPSLGIGLRVRKEGLLREAPEDIKIGEPAFDHAYTIAGHDPVQVRVFLKPIVQRLARHGFVLDQASDTRLVVECVDAKTQQALHAFLVAIGEVLDALPHALEAIPPMRDVALDFAGMREYAARVGGFFRAGNCSLQGRLPSGQTLSVRVIAAIERSNPLLLEVRLEGLEGELTIASHRMLMRGPESLRGLVRELDPQVSLEVEAGVGLAVLRAANAPLHINPALIDTLIGLLLRASHLASNTSAFR
jgi:hypothetical protein